MNNVLNVSGGFVKVLCSLLKIHESWVVYGYTAPLLAMPYLGNDSNILSLVLEWDMQYNASGGGQVGTIEKRLRVIKKNIHQRFSFLQ